MRTSIAHPQHESLFLARETEEAMEAQSSCLTRVRGSRIPTQEGLQPWLVQEVVKVSLQSTYRKTETMSDRGPHQRMGTGFPLGRTAWCLFYAAFNPLPTGTILSLNFISNIKCSALFYWDWDCCLLPIHFLRYPPILPNPVSVAEFCIVEFSTLMPSFLLLPLPIIDILESLFNPPSINEAFNEQRTGNPGITSWHCVWIICRDLSILLTSMASLLANWQNLSYLRVLPTSVHGFCFLMCLNVVWIEQGRKKRRTMVGIKNYTHFVALSHPQGIHKHNSSLYANCHCVLPGTLFLQYLQHLPSPLKVFTQRPSSPWGLPNGIFKCQTPVPPTTLPVSFPLWQLSPCRVIFYVPYLVAVVTCTRISVPWEQGFVCFIWCNYPTV